MNERREKSAVDHSPVGDEDSAVEPASSVEHEIDDPGGGADDNVPGGGSINSVEHELDDPGGGAADDDPGGGSITSADADSALIVSNASKTSSSPLLSSFATGLTSSRDSSSIVAKDLVSDDSDDEDVEYMGHFCSECSLFLLLGVCVGVGEFVGMMVLGCEGSRSWVCVLRRLRY